ncbi:MAG TPA: hypothetical protein VKG45_10745 [Actinomycetes bacterium]|nr:hypothetical protein [Actinomycetes bacterium]
MHPDPDRRRPREPRPPAHARRARARVGLAAVALACAGTLLLLGAPAALAQAPPSQQAPAADQQCSNVTNPLVARLCKEKQAGVDATKKAAADTTQSVVSSAGDSALRGLTAAVAAAGGWVLEKVGAAITGTTSPEVNAGWFASQYQVMLALAVLLALPMLLLSVMQGVLRGDMGHIMRSAFVYLPLAGIFSFVAPAIAQLLIALSDWMSLAVSANAAADAQKFMTEAGQALTTLGAGTATPGVPVFGILLGSLLVLLGGFSIWIELLLRAAAIYVCVLFLPIGFAAMIWPGAMKLAKRLIEFLVAIIFAKVFIVAIVSLAASGLANSGWGDSFEGILAGSAMLLIAASSPVALLKLIPIAEAGIADASGQRSNLRRATYAGSVLTGSQVVSGMIQTRFRSGTALPAATAAGAVGATAGAAAVTAAAAQARSGTAAMRNKVNTTLDSGATLGGAAAQPSKDPPPSGGGTGNGGVNRPDPGRSPFTDRSPDA